jgi:hypothetical protein
MTSCNTEGTLKKPKALCRLQHGKTVTSAYWSPHTGTKLLTTCKDDKLRIWNDLPNHLSDQQNVSGDFGLGKG